MNIITIPASEIQALDSLWVTASGHAWVGPVITKVEIGHEDVVVHTVNGGQRGYGTSELVAVVR